MNHVRKCWVHRPDRGIVKKQAVREYLYAFAIVFPQTGETCSIISPFCNTEAMNALLIETSITFAHYRIVMIMDSTNWEKRCAICTMKKVSLDRSATSTGLIQLFVSGLVLNA